MIPSIRGNIKSIWDVDTNDGMRGSSKWLTNAIQTDWYSEWKHSTVNILESAQNLRAISNFIYILNGDSTINVAFKTKQIPPANTIIISPDINTDTFDATVGLALRDASRILYKLDPVHRTIVKFASELCATYPSSGNNNDMEYTLKLIHGMIENLCVDSLVYKSCPGYRLYYASLYQQYFFTNIIQLLVSDGAFTYPSVINYLKHLSCIHSPIKDINALPGLLDIWNKLDIDNIRRFSNPNEISILAAEILEIILLNTSTTGAGDGNDSTGGGGSNGGNQDILSPEVVRANLIFDRLFKLAMHDDSIKSGSLTVEDANLIGVLASSDMDFRNTKYNGEKVDVVHIKHITDELINSRMGASVGFKQYGRMNILSGISNGYKLASRLQFRDMIRNINHTRLSSGKIDSRLLHSIPTGNENIFSQTIEHSFDDVFVHISLDQSGSMTANENWKDAINVAASIAVAATIIKNLRVVVSTRSTFKLNAGNDTPFVMEIFDSNLHGIDRIRRIFATLHPTGMTPEGLVFDVINDDIIRHSNNTSAYFINICDGSPMVNIGTTISYSGFDAEEHTKQQRLKLQNNGINIIGYFLGNNVSDQYRAFKHMYGEKNSSHLSNMDDMTVIVDAINKRILENDMKNW